MSGGANGNATEAAAVLQQRVQETCAKLDRLVTDKITGSEKVLELLKELEKQPIDLDILQNTTVGKIVNTLRKETQNEQVSALCKGLVKAWKGLLKGSPKDGSDSPGQQPSKKDAGAAEPQRKRLKTQLSESGSGSPLATAAPAGGDAAKPLSSPATAGPARSLSTGSAPHTDVANGRTASKSSNGASAADTTDPNRIKSRELIVKALSKDGLVEGAQDPNQLASDIETCVFQEFHAVDTRYKNRIRSRVMNLQDTRNPSLRENVLLGMITGQRFASMSSEEMASEEMKTIRQKYTKEAINDRQMSAPTGMETDLLQCGKCRQRKCTYTQAQTRSADEPMTTFALCLACGNRWKFC